MQLLLDESVPVRLRRHLLSHSVSTVVELGWSGKRNGALLAAAAARFDAIVTVDKNLRHQQNLSTLPISIVILEARSNDLASLLPLLPKLEAALSALKPRTLLRILA